MNNNIEEDEAIFIDLTDDPPDGVTASASNVKSVEKTIVQTQLSSSISQRRKSSDSDIVIIEDDETAEPPQPEVACHFFYPSEDTEGNGEGEGHDPLAPIPEWVDCSTLESEQVTVSERLAPESSPVENTTSFAYCDPLEPILHIKTEPQFEIIDVKPSIAELSQVVHGGKNVSSLYKEITTSSVKKESLNTEGEINTVSKKRKNSHDLDLDCHIPSKKLNVKNKVGPKCSKFRQEKGEPHSLTSAKKGVLNAKVEISTVSNKRKNSSDIDLDSNIPSKKLDIKSMVGPKCAKFRQGKDESRSLTGNKKYILDINVNKTLPNNPHTSRSDGPKCAKFRKKKDESHSLNVHQKYIQDIHVSKTTIPNKFNNSRSVGPKCAKLKQKENKSHSLKTISNPNSVQDLNNLNKTNTSRIVGPKCAKLRLKGKELHDPNFNQHYSQGTHLNTASPTNKVNPTLRRVGPKCAKFKEKEKELNTPGVSQNNQHYSQGTHVNTASPTNKANPTLRRVGPKCAKFREKEKELKTPNVSQKHLEYMNVNNALLSKKVNTPRKVGPLCAKFRQNEKLHSPCIDQNHSQDINVNTLTSKKSNTSRKVGPKCAKFRMKEAKEPAENQIFKNSPFQIVTSQTEKTEDNIVIKPAVVSIGPKLPLPQCFKQNLPSREITDRNITKCGDLDKDHIVLKIYTCTRCNHKCTDPLFHEAHMDLCSSKRRIKSLNLPIQEFNKQNGFYKCEICTFKFQNQENLNTHLNLHDVKGFLCHICHLTFLTPVKLNQHTMNDHKNLEKVFSCNICDYASQNVHHLRDHMVRHNQDKHLFCTYCKHNYENLYEIEKHLEEFHTKLKKKCLDNVTINQIEKADVSEVNSVNSVGKKVSCTKVKDEKELEIHNAIVHEISRKETSLASEAEGSEDIKYSITALEHFEAEIVERNGLYHCNGCVYKFAHLKNLLKHKKHHLQNKPFSCCNGSFVSFSYLRYSKHVDDESHEMSRLSCSMCPKQFAQSKSLGEHMIRHINDGLFCFCCRKNLENPKTYKSHVFSKHKRSIISEYTCSECSFQASSATNLKKHLAKHRQIKKEPEILTLVKCNEADENQTKRVAEQLKSEVCLKLSDSRALIEQKTFGTENHEHEPTLSSSLLEKSVSIRENETFKCNKCTFICSQPITYIEHLKSGHGKNKFICNVCRNDFSFLKFYLDHMINHAACAVVYSCNECRFISKKKQIFTKHMRTHALKCCPLCDYKSLRFDSFKSHLLTIHTVENEGTSSENVRIPSFTSNNTTKTNENLPETMDSKLQTETIKNHACCFCPYKTDQIFNLRKHMAIHFINTKNKEHSNRVAKPRLTVKRLKTKTLSARHIQGRSQKLSKRPNKTGNDLILLYSCTQCEYKKRDRKSVALHLLTRHNIKGSVRKHTIKKILAKWPLTKDTKEQIVFETENVTSNKHRSMPQIHDGLSRLTSQNESRLNIAVESDHGTQHDSVESNNVIQSDQKYAKEKISKKSECSKPVKKKYGKCSSCDLQKLSLLAQLQHKKYGHVDFWKRPFSCKICGFRSADKANLNKHLKWKHAEIKNKDKKTIKIKMQKNVELKRETKNTDQPENNICVNDKKKLNDKKGRRKIVIDECPGCNLMTLSKKAQMQHKQVGHDAFWDRSFPCNICGMRFPNQGSLGSHIVVHDTTLTCTNCNSFVTFKLKYLMEHKQICVKSDFEKAENNSYSTPHETNGTGDLSSDDEEKYACGECDFVTTNVIKFSTHMFIHSGIPDD